MAVKFVIQRFDSEKDSAPRMEEFNLEIPKGATLLDCINLIKWEQDGTLTLRMSCRSAICGSCAMRVNGHARLACKTQAVDVVTDNKVVIAPLGNFPVIKDLVVDLEPFWASLERIDPWLKPNESVKWERERLQTHDDEKLIDDASTCILCASCYSDCNVMEVDKNYMGPATLAKAQRFVFDTRDVKTKERLDQLNELTGIWDCTHCAECSTRCPTDTKPLARITELKARSMEHGYSNSAGSRHVLAFRESIPGKYPGTGGGLINENYIPPRSLGFFNIPALIGILPVGIRMMIRGKMPPLLPHTIEKFDEIKRMFGRFKEYLK